MFRGPTSTASPRQRTLGEMVQWSYELLAPPVQSSFATLGVFASSFTLAAAEAVCSSASISTRQVIDHADDPDRPLAASSATSRCSGSSRYRLLETLRLFAVERLAESGELESAPRPRRVLPGPGRRGRRPHVRTAGAHVAGTARARGAEPARRAAVGCRPRPGSGSGSRSTFWPYWDARWRERQASSTSTICSACDCRPRPSCRAWAITASAAMTAMRRGAPGGSESDRGGRRPADAIGDEQASPGAWPRSGWRWATRVARRGRARARRRARRSPAGSTTRHDRPPARPARLHRRRRGDHAVRLRSTARSWRSSPVSAVAEARRPRSALAVSLRHLGDDEEAALLCHGGRSRSGTTSTTRRRSLTC